jgi:UDP-N-acetyl-D-mannosaminuronate dehydrogenase
VAVLGMAFKGIPATADQRNGFGGELVAALRFLRPGLVIRTWDPVAATGSVARRTAVHGAAVVVLANDHPDLAGIMDDGAALAPRAVVYDMTSVLPRAEIGPGVEVCRFGDGGYGR